MRLLRNSRHNVHRGAEISPLAQREGVRRRQRTSHRAEREDMVAKFGQFLDHILKASDSSEGFSAIEVPETPQARRCTHPLRSSPVTRSASTRANEEASRSSRTPNARVEVRVCIPGRSDECHIVEDTSLRSSPPQLRSAGPVSTRSFDSGFFSDPDHGSAQASRDANPPSMRELHSDPDYDPEADYYETLTAIDKMKREVKLSRDPRLQAGEKPTRTNIGEGSELETMLLTEIASRLFSNNDWAWTFYYLMCNKMYDETTCITSVMRREFKGIQPRYRRDDLGSACDYCIKEHLPCVRLMVDSKGVRRFSVAALPRELKLAYAGEKNLGYYVLTSGGRR